MKILFDFQNTSGGAPRSHLEHAKTLKSFNHEIIAVVDDEKKKVKRFFNNIDCSIYRLPTFGKKNTWQRINIFFKYLKLIKKIDPDLLYSNRTTHVYFLSILSDLLGIPILCAQAGGTNIANLHKINTDRNYILYSEENRNDFIDMGFSNENLFVIQNRVPEIKKRSHNNYTNDNLKKVLLTSNIKKETQKGIINLMKEIIENRELINESFELNIAGKFIGLSHEEKKNMRNYFKHYNNVMNGISKLNTLGWVDDIEEKIIKADICLGKGRSIIQPLMVGKTGFVISESNGVIPCNLKNFKKLSETNFTGRNYNDKVGIEKFLNKINYIDRENNSRLIHKVKKEYSSQFLDKKLTNVLNIVLAKKTKKRKLKGIVRMFHLMLLGINKKI